MRLVRRITTVLFVVTLAVWIATGVIAEKKQNKDFPVITAESDTLQLSVADGAEKLLTGLSASDQTDGDLTADIMIGSRSRFSGPGVLEVTYIVFDKDNNSGRYTRKIEYTDYQSPQFSLEKPLVFGVGETVSVMDSLTLKDVIDGDISGKIKIVSSNVDTSKEGVYMIGVEAMNAYGDMVTLELPVSIVTRKAAAPEIALSEYLIYVDKNSSFDPKNYVESVTLADGTPADKSLTAIAGQVETEVPGCYSVLYSYQDADGNKGYTSLTVIVKA